MRWILFVALASCGHGAAASSGGFRVFYPNDTAMLHTHFQLKPSATCTYDDGREARWETTGARIESGKLPPGLDLEDAAINGTATATGTFHARVLLSGVTCAGKAQPDQHVDVTITVY